MNSSARIVAICNAKGGAGKTTTTMSLAAGLAERGHRVLVADCDAQASASAWANAAPDDKPFPATVVNLSTFGGRVHREIQKQLGNYDFIVVDCPPGLESLSPQSAILVADLVIVPLPPSPADLWAACGVKSLIERGMDLNPSLKAFILPNRVVRTSLSNAILRELKKFGIPVMSSRLTNRTAYQEAVVSGMAVCALGRSAMAAAQEIHALAEEVSAILGSSK